MEMSTPQKTQDNPLQAEKKEMAALKHDLIALKVARVEDKQQLGQDRDTIQQNLQKLQKRTIDTIEALFAKHVREVDQNHIKLDDGIDDDIAKINDMHKKVESRIQTLDTKRETSQLVQEIDMKLDAKQLIAKTHERTRQEALRFQFDSFIKEEIPTLQAVGSLSFEPHRDRNKPKLHYQECEYTLTNAETGNIRLHYKDEKQCRFLDSCQLQDGSYAVTDINHGQVLHLDNKLNVMHSAVLHTPWGICYVRPDEVAVTLVEQKKVHLVKIAEDGMKLGISFDVGEICRGILFHDNLFYICCGGGSDYSIWSSRRECQGQIRMFGADGVYKSVFMKCPTDGRRLFQQPRCIILHPDKSLFYITDGKQSVVVLGLNGRYQSTIKHPDIAVARAITFDNRDQLFVACMKNNHIVQFTKNGERMGVMITREQLKATSTLRSIHFDPVLLKLLVTCEEKEIQLLQLEAKQTYNCI